MNFEEMQYQVVINEEEHYSIWPIFKDIPLGWQKEGQEGTKNECLDHIEKVWTDMRPLSLRKWLAEQNQTEGEIESKSETDVKPMSYAEHSQTVNKLLSGSHSINLSPISRFDDLIESIKRKYLFVTFIDTLGGTTLGLQLDENSLAWEKQGFPTEEEFIEVQGNVTLDSSPLCIRAKINLKSLNGIATVYLE